MPDATRDLGQSRAPLFAWRAAIGESSLSPATRHVLLQLSLYMDDQGAGAFPGAARLARETGLHVSTVREYLGDAVAGCWLELVRRGGTLPGGRRVANSYRASFPRGWGQAAAPAGDNDDPPPATGRLSRADPSPQPRLPLAPPDTNSSLNSPRISPSAPLAEAGDNCVCCRGSGEVWNAVGGFMAACECRRLGARALGSATRPPAGFGMPRSRPA